MKRRSFFRSVFFYLSRAAGGVLAFSSAKASTATPNAPDVPPSSLPEPTASLPSFSSPALLISSPNRDSPPGTLWRAENYYYMQEDSRYNLLTRGGRKLRLLLDNTGGFNARALGSIADGKSHPLRERYQTIEAAQAALPLCSTAGWITSLEDEIDWACIQEMLLVAQSAADKPFVRIGPGIHYINRTILASGNGKGIAIVGTDYRVGQQGSQRTGTTLRYTGNKSEPLLEIRGTFTKLLNIAFENTGSAQCAVRITGFSPRTGGGRNHMEGISIQEGEIKPGLFAAPFTNSAFEIINGIDYTYWRDIELAISSPHAIYFDGGLVPNGGTTRFELANSVISLIGETAKKVIYIRDSNIENIKVTDVSFNNYSKKRECILFDCDDIDPRNVGNDINILTFDCVEVDGISDTPTTRWARLTNVRMASFLRSFVQNASAVQTGLVELLNSFAKADSCHFYSVNGPVFLCRDDRSRVIPGNNIFTSVRGLADQNLRANIIRLAAARAISLTGVTIDARNQIYELEVEEDQIITISARTHVDRPASQWLQGQLVTLRIVNTSDTPRSKINWAAGIKAAPFTSLNPRTSRSINFFWDGNNLVETSRSLDIPN